VSVQHGARGRNLDRGAQATIGDGNSGLVEIAQDEVERVVRLDLPRERDEMRLAVPADQLGRDRVA
jgi:hypothetical protein